MSANERAIVANTHNVVDGGTGDALRKVLYALYVSAFLLMTYGVTLAHAFFMTQDPDWLRAQVVSWRGALVLVVVVVVGAAAAWRAGRVRGPVVPVLPWIDLITSGPLDRAITLRRSWLIALSLAVTGAAMVGMVIGGGAWFARVGNAMWLVVGALAATALGIVLLLVWLAGQVSTSSRDTLPLLWRPRAALRMLRLEDLRTQASRATRMGGAVLLGDLRALRLEIAVPVTRGRHRRLRPGRAWTATPRRDLLGMLRAPGSAVIAALVTLVGAGALSWALMYPAVPVVVALAGGVVLHLGFAAAAEGLRLQGDNAGTPPLLGFSFRTEAVGHLALPLLVSGGTALATAAVVGWSREASAAYVLGTVGWMCLMVTMVVGTTMASAFRGSAPVQAFLPESGPIAMAMWMARQVMVAAFATGVSTAVLARTGPGPVLWAAVFVAVALVRWGFSRVREVALEHRV